MNKERIELNQFEGSKRNQLAQAVNELLSDMNLISEGYFDNESNEVEAFQMRLASETVNDTQAVTITVGEPVITMYDHNEALYTDDEAGEDGGLERIVRKFVVNDLKESNVHIILTFDI